MRDIDARGFTAPASPPGPGFPPAGWTIAVETAKLTASLVEWLTKMASKPAWSKNPSQTHAAQLAQDLYSALQVPAVNDPN